jgi:hypothetical protein
MSAETEARKPQHRNPSPPAQSQQGGAKEMPQWLPLEGAELLSKAYMVASDDRGANAIAAIRKDTRRIAKWQWKKGFKWVAFLSGAPLTFDPAYYQELNDNWAMRE